MNIIKVKLKERSYDIIIGQKIMGALGGYLAKLKLGADAYIITNESIKSKYGAWLKEPLEKGGFTLRFKCVPDSEESKSIGMVSAVIEDLVRYDKKRKIFIIALGGGVIGDLAGFIASVYKRGVPYIQIPTTLLAQVDSSIGGKTAIDLAKGKNLVGAFYQPRLVYSDLAVLRSLSLKQLQNGLAEVIKYAIIKDPELFVYIEKHCQDIFALKSSALEFIVSRCSRIKADIVGKDEKESRGLRTILNFGHTIGHAIETAGGYKKYTHGQAVALGMLVACDISRSLKLIDQRLSKRIENVIRLAGLPLKLEGLAFSDIIEAHYRDKKFIGSKNRFVLIAGLGKVVIRNQVPLQVITAALKERF